MSKDKFSEVDIAININLHTEGDLIYKTFRSIIANIDYLLKKQNNVSVVVNILLDKADALTKEYVDKYNNLFTKRLITLNTYEENFGDLSLSRNFLIDKAISQNAKFIQIYDGDDLFTENSLFCAYSLAKKSSRPAAYVPKFVIDMDEWAGLVYSGVNECLSTNDPRQILTNLYSRNLYQSQMLVDSRIFKKLRYKPHYPYYHFEDYCMVMDIVAEKYNIIAVPDTAILYRRKNNGSLLSATISSNRCLAPTKFFEPTVFRELSYKPSNSLQINKYNEYANGQSTEYYPEWMKLYRSHAHNFLLHGKYMLIELCKSARNVCVKLFGKVRGKDKKNNQIDYSRFYRFGFSDELFGLIQKLNQIEPLAIYNTYFVNNAPCLVNLWPTKIDDIYYDLCSLKGIEETTDVILVPHITQGGADKAMLELCRVLSKAKRKVLMIATASGEVSNWAKLAQDIDGVIFLERDKFFNQDNINDKDLEVMLLRMIQNWPKLKTLTVMNSGVGYNLINDWHKEIRKFVKIYVHSWCYFVNEFGMLGEPFKLSKIYNCIDYLITDGEAYKKQLMDINGWDGEKILPIYLPINPVEQKTDYSIKRKIMYAGRFGSQKRIDLILQSHEELAKNDIDIVFYGSVDQSDDLYDSTRDMDLIESSDNTEYAGSFNDFNKLPINDVDILILPTQYEGLPNIVLEALKANLFVIAGDAGSIGSVVKDYKNGFLVKENGSAEAYKQAILNFYNQQDKLLTPSERLKFNKKILHNHDQDVYEKNIMDVYGK